MNWYKRLLNKIGFGYEEEKVLRILEAAPEVGSRDDYMNGLMRRYGEGAAPKYSPPEKTNAIIMEEIRNLEKEISNLKSRLKPDSSFTEPSTGKQ